jgi:antitoxin VapB
VILAGRHRCLYVYTKDLGVPLNIRSEAVNQLAERLAARKQMNKTEAVRVALENELRRLDEAVPLRDRLLPLQKRVLNRPPTGLEADKAFYDELSGNG